MQPFSRGVVRQRSVWAFMTIGSTSGRISSLLVGAVGGGGRSQRGWRVGLADDSTLLVTISAPAGLVNRRRRGGGREVWPVPARGDRRRDNSRAT
jgi:hypothetical protein